MKIAVASGKGGTGKTTISVSLALALAKKHRVTLLDCDVEEPNAHLFLDTSSQTTSPASTIAYEVDSSLCNACGACGKVCRFNALAVVKTGPLFFPEMCHACGGCMLSCPTHAIHEIARENGTLSEIHSDNLQVFWGTLNVGEAMAAPLIREVRKHADPTGITILDSPPGTTCSMIAAVSDCDYVLLVTEPTPFGLNDLKLAIEATRLLHIPFGIVINQAEPDITIVEEYCQEQSIPIHMKVPWSRLVAEQYSRGVPLIASIPDTERKFQQMYDDVVSSHRDALNQTGPRG